MHLSASESGDEIIFLHRVQDGPANQSYGLQVAKLAGLPKDVIQQAQQKLHELELQEPQLSTPVVQAATPSNKPVTKASESVMQSDMFSAPQFSDAFTQAIKRLNPDDLSPKEALDLLYSIQKLRDE